MISADRLNPLPPDVGGTLRGDIPVIHIETPPPIIPINDVIDKLPQEQPDISKYGNNEEINIFNENLHIEVWHILEMKLLYITVADF